jgi:hypothetical protein
MSKNLVRKIDIVKSGRTDVSKPERTEVEEATWAANSELLDSRDTEFGHAHFLEGTGR